MTPFEGYFSRNHKLYRQFDIYRHILVFLYRYFYSISFQNMGKNKLAKFAAMDSYDNVFQFNFDQLKQDGFPLKGKWSTYFGNDNPIVLELGCGKGEYTVGLAKMFPDKNFIGIDIKGARMWTGATQAINEEMKNVAFIRTNIELIAYFFDADEVSEIWITFPDPQMKKVNKRLTSTRFMKEYAKILHENGIVHLKTDSQFLYTYTKAMVELNKLNVLVMTDNLYNSGIDDAILNIKTYYEQQWLARGLDIKYIKFVCPHNHDWQEPDIDIPKDDYRSFGRNARSIL